MTGWQDCWKWRVTIDGITYHCRYVQRRLIEQPESTGIGQPLILRWWQYRLRDDDQAFRGLK